MNIDIGYENAIDFHHCETLDFAGRKLSEITNYLNKVISCQHYAKAKILDECSKYPEEKLYKLSWENKIVCLKGACGRDPEILELIDFYNRADEAYTKLKNKQFQVYEDINRLKKIIDVTPR